MKRALTIVIVFLALGSMAYVLFGGRELRPTAGEATVSHAGGPGLVVYYFDMGKDCSTCLNLEAYTRETLEKYFAAELSSGAIRWEVVDVDLPENEHYVAEFGLYTKSVVLAVRSQDEIVWHDNLSRIWELVYDKGPYMEYIRAQVSQALGAER